MSRFATTRRHWKFRGRLQARHRAPGHRDAPVLVCLPAAGGAPDKPPVRIYVGSEPLQHRAERVFIWSVLKVRDPMREYRIYLMKDLVGFSRDGWKTGFKTYRYAVPSLAGNEGRAIYNDVDQIYLDDPAKCLDLDMNGSGVLCIDQRDSSVMLIDCARMAGIWTRESAERTDQHKVFRRAAQERGLWGALPARWHTRDSEFRAGESALLHFTTLHKQPWHPFPDALKYEHNEVGSVWHTLEREADEAGFTPWSKQQPSDHQRALYQLYRQMHAGDGGKTGMSAKMSKKRSRKATFGGGSLTPHLATIAALVHRYKPTTLLDYGSGKGGLYQDSPKHAPDSRYKMLADWPGVTVTCYDPGYEPFSQPVAGHFDAVISTDMLEHVPEEDVPWVLDELFARARRFLYLVAACFPARKHLPDGQNAHCTVMPPAWWAGQLEAAARRAAASGSRRQAASEDGGLEHTEPLVWKLCTREKSFFALHKRKGFLRPGIKSRYFQGSVDTA